MKKVVKKTRSPMNAVLWLLTLECGHTRWVSGAKAPLRACCRWCDAGKVLLAKKAQKVRSGPDDGKPRKNTYYGKPEVE